jgi:hypothetical protein
MFSLGLGYVWDDKGGRGVRRTMKHVGALMGDRRGDAGRIVGMIGDEGI